MQNLFSNRFIFASVESHQRKVLFFILFIKLSHNAQRVDFLVLLRRTQFILISCLSWASNSHLETTQNNQFFERLKLGSKFFVFISIDTVFRRKICYQGLLVLPPHLIGLLLSMHQSSFALFHANFKIIIFSSFRSAIDF